MRTLNPCASRPSPTPTTSGHVSWSRSCCRLKTAGLVVSVRGAAGGYQLARAPGQISLADVINAIDPEQPTRDPVGVPGSPVVQALQSVYKEIHAEEQRILKHLSLAELVRRIKEGNSLSYQI